MSAGERIAALRPYVGETVSLVAGNGVVKGKLTELRAGNAVLDGRARPLATAEVARVHIGGDWVSQTHRPNSLNTKLNVRCRTIDKQFIDDAAAALNVTLSDFVLNLALDRAAQVLGKPKP